jgi:hypothetical protein
MAGEAKSKKPRVRHHRNRPRRYARKRAEGLASWQADERSYEGHLRRIARKTAWNKANRDKRRAADKRYDARMKAKYGGDRRTPETTLRMTLDRQLNTDQIITMFVEAWNAVPRCDWIQTPKRKKKDKRKTKLPEPRNTKA